jgi:hypothetical protein
MRLPVLRQATLHRKYSADIARQWVRHLATAVREKDKRQPIMIGLVDWSLDRPGLTSAGSRQGHRRQPGQAAGGPDGPDQADVHT